MSQSCMRIAINSYSLLSSQHVQRTGTASVSLDLNNHNHSQKIIIFGLVFWMKMLKLWEIRSLASSHIASTWQISVLNSSLRLSPSPTTILPLSPLGGTVMRKEARDGKELCLLKAWHMFSTRRSAHALSHLIHLPHLERTDFYKDTQVCKTPGAHILSTELSNLNPSHFWETWLKYRPKFQHFKFLLSLAKNKIAIS